MSQSTPPEQRATYKEMCIHGITKGRTCADCIRMEVQQTLSAPVEETMARHIFRTSERPRCEFFGDGYSCNHLQESECHTAAHPEAVSLQRHPCPEWDYMIINNTMKEFEACLCFRPETVRMLVELPPLESCPQEMRHGYPDCDCDLEGGDPSCAKKPTAHEVWLQYGAINQRERQLLAALTDLQTERAAHERTRGELNRAVGICLQRLETIQNLSAELESLRSERK